MMKTVFHKIIAAGILLMIFKAAIDTSIYLLNLPYDFAFFAGFILSALSLFGLIFLGQHVFSPNFKTIKDLFIHK